MSFPLNITIPGTCPPAPRPRTRVVPGKGPRGAFAQIYTPTTGPYAEWKRGAAWVMQQAAKEIGGAIEQGNALEVAILFVLPLPVTAHRKTRHVPRSWCLSHRRGDLDNLAKGPLDAAKGTLWHDDRQVASLTLGKVVAAQGEEPRTEMRIDQLYEVHTVFDWKEGGL